MGHRFLLDIVADHLHAGGVAQKVVFAHYMHLAFLLRDHSHLLGVQPFPDAAAPADIGRCLHYTHDTTSAPAAL